MEPRCDRFLWGDVQTSGSSLAFAAISLCHSEGAPNHGLHHQRREKAVRDTLLKDFGKMRRPQPSRARGNDAGAGLFSTARSPHPSPSRAGKLRPAAGLPPHHPRISRRQAAALPGGAHPAAACAATAAPLRRRRGRAPGGARGRSAGGARRGPSQGRPGPGPAAFVPLGGGAPTCSGGATAPAHPPAESRGGGVRTGTASAPPPHTPPPSAGAAGGRGAGRRDPGLAL